jgi:hypothetical protein
MQKNDRPGGGQEEARAGGEVLLRFLFAGICLIRGFVWNGRGLCVWGGAS